MGDYLVVADVEAYYLNMDFSASGSAITEAEINTWITEAEAIINGALSQSYVVPVTNATDILQVKAVAIKYVLDNVNFTMGKSNFNVNRNNVLIPRKIDHSGFYDMLQQYVGDNPTLILPNTDRPSTDNKISIQSYNSANDIEPVAEKYTDQW